VEEVKLRNHFEEDDEYFVCAKCFNKLKAILHVRANARSLHWTLFTNTCLAAPILRAIHA
jgi:hypothetical protein